MADWFGKLMQKGQTPSRDGVAAAGSSKVADVGSSVDARNSRHDAIVQMLRDRAADDRVAREKRQRGYRQSLENDSGVGSSASSPSSPIRVHNFRTKVPCRATPEARALLEQLRKRFPGGTVSFSQLESGQQGVMVTASAGAEPKQIGWVEHSVEADPKLCNVRHHGLIVEATDDRKLILRFRYPRTPVRMSSRHNAEERKLHHAAHRIERQGAPPRGADGLQSSCRATDDVVCVDFTEIRPALDLRPSDRGTSPRLVWLTRPELETIDVLTSRDYEAFYVRFKLELLSGIWSSVSGYLTGLPSSQWHRGSHYNVVRESDATNGRIYQRTFDDRGQAVDIGSDRIYDAAPATDILLLHLEGDILADIAEIYFSLQSLCSADAYFLKEELFAVVRRFWAGAQSLAWRYGNDLPAVLRMCQRALPLPYQAPLLKQDWINLRQYLVDRYGEGGRRAGDLKGDHVYRPRVAASGWPFASFPTGEVNVGLRLVYRQDWRDLGPHRGEIVRSVRFAAERVEHDCTNVLGTSITGGTVAGRLVETSIERGDTTRQLDEVVSVALQATLETMKWPVDLEGSINTGVRDLAVRSELGLEADCRESSRITSGRLGDVMRRMTRKIRDEVAVEFSAESLGDLDPSGSTSIETAAADEATTHVYSRLQNHYEILTRPAELQNIVLVAEKLPTPAEIDLSWVRRHDWILANVLLDESFRDALNTAGEEAPSSDSSPSSLDHQAQLAAKRDRLYEHIRANILHYERAIWQQEDPQQRRMRYRKSGKKVPLEWRFELEAGGALTLDELGDRLTRTSVDGQFAAYSGGLEADLDQVIDPTGPIGYYGNYAVYHMRPEFGSEDMFSMLHFFKSPYLRPNPETGEPEVDDPAQIQIAENPATAHVSDELIDQHRAEMFQYVPELRLEFARACERARDGTDPAAVQKLERRAELLRPHFGTYLFRRDRTCRVALDTDGVVIDVIRRAEAAEDVEPGENAIDLAEAPSGYRVILETERDLEVVSASSRWDANGECGILQGDAERTPSLLAGAASRARGPGDREGQPVILDGDDSKCDVLAGRKAPATHGTEDDWTILQGEAVAAAGNLLVVAGATRRDDPAIQRVTVASADEPRASVLTLGGGRASRAEDQNIDRVLITRETGAITLPAAADADASQPDQRVILSRDDEEPMLELVGALRAPRADDEQVRWEVFSGAKLEQTLIPVPRTTGEAAEENGEDASRAIRAREEAGLRVSAGVGASVSARDEKVILSSADEAQSATLRPGTDPAAHALIFAEGDREGTLSLLVGAGVARGRDREAEHVLLVRNDGERTLSLLAGAGGGAARAHDREAARVIVARNDEFLRPSLVAG